MVGKLPNCSQARRSRTEERKRDLWIRQSPPRSQSRAMLQAPSLNAASEGWMSENQILLADRKKYFFLDIPFYRTFPHDDDGGGDDEFSPGLHADSLMAEPVHPAHLKP